MNTNLSWKLSSLIILVIFFQRINGQKVFLDPDTDCKNSQISIDDFNLHFYTRNQTIVYSGILNSKFQRSLNNELKANITARAFNKDILNQQQFRICASPDCTLTSGETYFFNTIHIPSKYTKLIDSVSNLDIKVNVDFIHNSDGKVGCFRSNLHFPSKTEEIISLRYATIGMALFALIMSIIPSLWYPGWIYGWPNLTLFSFLQTIAFSGMYSIPYPPLYRTFSESFSWSVGIINWSGLQSDILDPFRSHRGGDLSRSSAAKLDKASLTFPDYNNNNNAIIPPSPLPINNGTNHTLTLNNTLHKRQYNDDYQLKTAFDSVTGIKAFVESVHVPYPNAFMTALIWWLLALAVTLVLSGIVSVLLLTLCRRKEKPLSLIGTTVGSVVYPTFPLLYTSCVLWTCYQFTIGDSWVALLLAGLVLAIFTIVLLFGVIHTLLKIHSTTHQLPKYTGTFHCGIKTEKKHITSYWMIITLLASFGKGAFLGLGHSRAIIQITGTLVIETIILFVLVTFRPFKHSITTWFNAFGQIIQVICLVLFITFIRPVQISDSHSLGYAIAALTLQSVWAILLFFSTLLSISFKLYHQITNKDYNEKAEGIPRNHAVGDSVMSLDLPRQVREIPMMASESNNNTSISADNSTASSSTGRFLDQQQHPSPSYDDDNTKPLDEVGRFARIRNVSKSYVVQEAPPVGSDESIKAEFYHHNSSSDNNITNSINTSSTNSN